MVRGDEQAQYVCRRQGLTREEAGEVDAFLDRLRTQGELTARLAEFRFERERDAGTPTEESLAASRAQSARKLLLNAAQK